MPKKTDSSAESKESCAPSCDTAKSCCAKSPVALFVILGLLIAGVVAALAYTSGRVAPPEQILHQKPAAGSDSVSEAPPVSGSSGESEPEAEAEVAQPAPEPSPEPNSVIVPGNPVVARIGAEEITRSDVFEFIMTLPENIREIPVPQLYPLALQELVSARIIESRAEEAGIAETPAVQEQLEATRKQIVRSTYLNQQLESAITETRLKETYDSLVSSLPDVQETHARHILVEEESEAREIIAKLKEGTDFVELVSAHSTGPSADRGGDLGWFTKDEMIPEFAEEAFALEPNSFSEEPVKTQFGWHVIKVEERRQRPKPEFESVKPHLQNQLRQETLESLVEGWVKESGAEMFDINGQEPLDLSVESEQ